MNRYKTILYVVVIILLNVFLLLLAPMDYDVFNRKKWKMTETLLNIKFMRRGIRHFKSINGKYPEIYEFLNADNLRISTVSPNQIEIRKNYYDKNGKFIYFKQDDFFILLSSGPDGKYCMDLKLIKDNDLKETAHKIIEYDPTNGLYSEGDIIAYEDTISKVEKKQKIDIDIDDLVKKGIIEEFK